MIAGFAAESLLRSLLKACPKFKSFQLPSTERLLAIAGSSALGQRRIELALPYLQQEYRLSSTPDDWHQVPPTVILDYIFGIDCVVSFLGYAVAIDVTTNPQAIAEKVSKLQSLKPLWQQLGIDRACICHLSPGITASSVWDGLKKTLKSEQVIEIAITI